jgi:hypothetical protein
LLKGALKRKRGLNDALEKEIGLENTLPKRWWLNGALEKETETPNSSSP